MRRILNTLGMPTHELPPRKKVEGGNTDAAPRPNSVKLLPEVRVKTQLFQITPKTTGTNLITGASVWTRVRLSRRGGGDTFRVSTNQSFAFAAGIPLPVNKVTTIVLGPGDALYYKATSAADRVSVAVMAVAGIEGFDG